MTSGSHFLLQRNDRIVFLGDSITEQQLYTNYVESYLASRFPQLRLSFFNAGWGGDSAPGGAARLQRDVLALKPTVVTLCYGMNDGRYSAPTDEIRTTYVNGMRALVAALKAAGARIVLLTPGMVDETVAPHLAPVQYNQRGLRILADEVLKLAAEEGLPSFDLHKLMNEVDRRGKAADPKFCMIPDSVHPDPAGHLVMAFALLQALGVPPRQQQVAVDYGARRATASPGIKAGRVVRNPHGFSLELRLDALPFYVEPLARKVLPFLPFQETYNNLKFSVHGLPAPRGYFRSELLRTPSLQREEFEEGINLFGQWGLGVVQKAEMVHRYTLEKDQVYYKTWRTLGLNGLNSPYYNAKAHAAGIRQSPALDRARDTLLGRQALVCRLNVVATDLPGEPLLSGDFISQWSLLGPFPKPYATDHLGGEAAFTGQPPRLATAWRASDLNLANSGNVLNEVFGAQIDCYAYAVTLLESPVDQAATLLVGSDDGFAAWLNGTKLAENLNVARPLAVDQERMPVRLRAGTNVLLLKISQGLGSWGFCARFDGLRKPVAAMRPPRV